MSESMHPHSCVAFSVLAWYSGAVLGHRERGGTEAPADSVGACHDLTGRSSSWITRLQKIRQKSLICPRKGP